MRKGSIEPTRLSGGAGNFLLVLAVAVLALGVYSWRSAGSLPGLLLGLVSAAALLGLAKLARRKTNAERTLAHISAAAGQGSEISALEIDEQLGAPPPPSDQGIRPGGPLSRDR